MSDLVSSVDSSAVIDPQTRVVPSDFRGAAMALPVDQMRVALAEYGDRRAAFRQWVMGQLIQGVHFGTPPGCEPKGNVKPEQWQARPSLYKAGAEFLCDLLHVRPEFEADEAGWRQLGSKPGTFVYRCRLLCRETGKLIGEGRGARRVGQKGGDENNAVKMAQKSAKVDAVLNAWGLSDLFTQDLEDQRPAHENPQVRDDRPRAEPREKRVTKEDIASVSGAWKGMRHEDDHTLENWSAWVAQQTGRTFDVTKASQWTRADLLAVQKAVDKEAGIDDSEIPF